MRPMRRVADRLVRLIARAATLGWFRAVEVTGLERIPRTGPVLLVANHHGGFVDPALLVAMVPRPVRFLAMASLFRILPLRPLLALGGAIPVHRAQDAEGRSGTRRNVDTFAACFAHLRDGVRSASSRRERRATKPTSFRSGPARPGSRWAPIRAARWVSGSCPWV